VRQAEFTAKILLGRLEEIGPVAVFLCSDDILIGGG